MARSPGISGLGVAIAAAGGLLAYSAVKNVSLVDALRDVLAGRAPGTTGSPTGASLGSITTNVDAAIAAAAAIGSAAGVATSPLTGGAFESATTRGGAIVAAARKYLGVKYVFGGNFTNGGGGDCSGLVYRALNDAGIPAPRLTAAGYMTWSGVTTIPNAQRNTGDLVCYGGHIGIAMNHDEMIHAPHTGDVVRIAKIYGSPVTRRVK